MKCEIREKNEVFRPFELVIKIENVKELVSLAKLFNLPVHHIDRDNQKYFPGFEYSVDNFLIWDKLDKLADVYVK